MRLITKNQLEQIEDAASYGMEKFHETLEKITGITAVPYTAYLYYDAEGNYIGDSDNSEITDLLESAYIEVTDHDSN